MEFEDDEQSKKYLKRLERINELQLENQNKLDKSRICLMASFFSFLIFGVVLALYAYTDPTYEASALYGNVGGFGVLFGIIFLSQSSYYSSQAKKSRKSIEFQRRMHEKYD
ncbi:MAG: hypothetical protein VW982_05595 [Candidatus Poseidoniales archaeon]|jgi:hypothetical protein